jgi:uncharacterized protein YndB with AHSA1/START domain
MRTVEASATYSASPEQVWDVMADPGRWDEWLIIHKSWKTAVPARVTQAVTATAAARVMNMPITVDWTFDKVDAPKMIEMGGSTRAGVKLALVITLADAGTSTRVDLTVSIDGGMIDTPMGGVFRKSLTGALDKSLRNVAELLA